MKHSAFKKCLRAAAFLLCAGLMVAALSFACRPKTYNGSWNYVAKMNEFYALEEDSLDYICVGSSHAYCTVNPLEIWKKADLAGFVLATQKQPLDISYYYIKEAFKTQSPEVVLLESFMIAYEDEYAPDAVHSALDPLRPSFNKLQLIHDVVDFENRPEYYFDIIKYHTRWTQVSPSELLEAMSQPEDTYKGFVPLSQDYSGKNVNQDYEGTAALPLCEKNQRVLEQIYDLVHEKGAELVLMIAPYDDDPEATAKIKSAMEWAEEKDITVLDYSSALDALELDPNCDYFDARHLDISGAAKISWHLADFLTEYGLTGCHRIDTEKWQNDFDLYRTRFASEFS